MCRGHYITWKSIGNQIRAAQGFGNIYISLAQLLFSSNVADLI